MTIFYQWVLVSMMSIYYIVLLIQIHSFSYYFHGVHHFHQHIKLEFSRSCLTVPFKTPNIKKYLFQIVQK